MTTSQRALRDKLRRLNEEAKCLTETEHKVIHRLSVHFFNHGELKPNQMREMNRLFREKVIE